MRRGETSRQLLSLAGVRELQRLRAENQAMIAAAELQEKNTALEVSQGARDAVEQSWLTSLASRDVPLEVSSLWSAELRRRDDAAATAAREADAAAAELENSTKEYDQATLRRDAVRDLARDSKKRDARKADDEAAQNALDRHLSRRRVE